MNNGTTPGMYNRALLLHGAKRNVVLSLEEVQRYGSDSFSDPDYIRIYGMRPAEWYVKGVRLLGRTAVECTRDALGDLIGRDVAAVASTLPAATTFAVVDPFAGSCNTLYWILRHVPNAHGIACEHDPQVYALTKRNIATLDRKIELVEGDYLALLNPRKLPTDRALIFFIAPPWGTVLDEKKGLDLRRTEPPITEIIGNIAQTWPAHKILFAIQVYEKINSESLRELRDNLDWSDLKVYSINDEGRNHGVLLGTKGWEP